MSSSLFDVIILRNLVLSLTSARKKSIHHRLTSFHLKCTLTDQVSQGLTKTFSKILEILNNEEFWE